MPKSAMTMSECSSCVRYKIFSGLVRHHHSIFCHDDITDVAEIGSCPTADAPVICATISPTANSFRHSKWHEVHPISWCTV